jgi:hypothetical protein
MPVSTPAGGDEDFVIVRPKIILNSIDQLLSNRGSAGSRGHADLTLRKLFAPHNEVVRHKIDAITV